MNTVPEKHRSFWSDYLLTSPDQTASQEHFYETFRIGMTEESADEGAALILRGLKTATSSLLWEYEVSDKPLPRVGSLSILEDGRGDAVAIIESKIVRVVPFSEIDAAFAFDYGEGDRTLDGWQKTYWLYYRQVCEGIGKEASRDMPLVCERFHRVYPA